MPLNNLKQGTKGMSEINLTLKNQLLDQFILLFMLHWMCYPLRNLIRVVLSDIKDKQRHKSISMYLIQLSFKTRVLKKTQLKCWKKSMYCFKNQSFKKNQLSWFPLHCIFIPALASVWFSFSAWPGMQIVFVYYNFGEPLLFTPFILRQRSWGG